MKGFQLGNLLVAAIVGVASGVYIFDPPLRQFGDNYRPAHIEAMKKEIAELESQGLGQDLPPLPDFGPDREQLLSARKNAAAAAAASPSDGQ
ncbi:hypothetical protein H696_05181 [Fonticula alba]|uniref:Uncharacterized protein n=1 Tax=Fonticula alba TaxID=691883 RepID=A0A058Z1U5_FONAL|nr:hypothetical protein H696_05181 [Fonticula alba]KCV68259.1 hypothetical protein H696_05181 [Fonticula alba]|eukprot:XP_009497313.1 hypothetical protein H696_05181 [Fonticula alba]